MEQGEESFLLVYLFVLGLYLYFLWLGRDKSDYTRISSSSFAGTLTSFFGAFRYLYDAPRMLQEGYSKFSGGIFKVPTLSHWIVIITKPKHIEELRKAPDDDLSASEAMLEVLQLPFTVDSSLFTKSQLKSLLGTQLTRNLDQLLPEMHSEMEVVVDELISSEPDEWKYIDETELVTRICNRVINRALVGTSLCRNPEFSTLTVKVTSELERHAKKLRYCPVFLRPIFSFLFTPFTGIRRQMRSLVSNTLKERQETLVKHGQSFPNDMITWFIGHDAKSEMSLEELAAHVLMVNYLAVHPTAKVMSQVLLNLAKYPEQIQLLRTEVESIIRKQGWSKSAVEKMYGVERFVKETMRLEESVYNTSYPYLAMSRKSLRPFTFSDGTTVPSNALLFVGSQLIHTDAQYYSPAPRVFNPLRFSSADPDSDSSTGASTRNPSLPQSFSFLASSPPSSSSSSPSQVELSESSSPPKTSSRSVPGPQAISSMLPATSPTFLAWGHGKHACPGRFFAAATMKLLLAYLVLEFDFRVPASASIPEVPLHRGDEGGIKERTDQCGEDKKVLWIEVRRRRGKTEVPAL